MQKRTCRNRHFVVVLLTLLKCTWLLSTPAEGQAPKLPPPSPAASVPSSTPVASQASNTISADQTINSPNPTSGAGKLSKDSPTNFVWADVKALEIYSNIEHQRSAETEQASWQNYERTVLSWFLLLVGGGLFIFGLFWAYSAHKSRLLDGERIDRAWKHSLVLVASGATISKDVLYQDVISGNLLEITSIIGSDCETVKWLNTHFSRTQTPFTAAPRTYTALSIGSSPTMANTNLVDRSQPENGADVVPPESAREKDTPRP